MKTVAIVCEYNPFHLGHEHQIKEIRRQFGEDTAIVAIMSGNYVERADLAILGKFDRAKMAVDCGASLVLELPFPFSSASAEYFAQAAVGIAEGLGCIDYLSFGSECGDLARLISASDRISSDEFRSALDQLLESKENASLGYAKSRAVLYEKMYGEDDAKLLSSPNNILAIEYLRALRRFRSPIKPHTVLRVGTDSESKEDGAAFAGATYIRSLLMNGHTAQALEHLPKNAQKTLIDAIEAGRAPALIDGISVALLSDLRLEKSKEAAECGGGLYGHLKKTASTAGTISEFFRMAATKKFTDARLRRATLFSYFGVTPAMLREDVQYTQVLAMDSIGQAVLHHIRKSAGIAILTKPADTDKLSPSAKAQADLVYRADSVYTLAFPKPQAADIFLRTSPYRK